jgi:hypothetical protein
LVPGPFHELFADSFILFPSPPMPTYSKKEYFLAQIREKDSIIESLIKEVSSCREVFDRGG